MPFHDAHHLAELVLQPPVWVIFLGVSGSGKSTSIDWLRRQRPELDWIEVEEIVGPSDLLSLRRELPRDRCALIASHLKPVWHRLIRPPGRGQILIQVDRDRGQLETYLRDRQISFSREALSAFKKRFQTSFVDLRSVLELTDEGDFDQGWTKFEKQRDIDRTPEPKAIQIID
ncbi:MAG: hypothetical protein AAF236_01155 [Verrucomicrobiota bacterium]